MTPSDACLLLQEEVFGRLAVHDLPADGRLPMLQAAARDHIAGGRIYDAHIAETARAAGATVVVTDNRRHFSRGAPLRHPRRNPVEFATTLKTKR